MSLFVGQDRGGRMSNPEIPFWQTMVCFGYKKSSMCPDIPLHPLEEERKARGLETSKGKTPKTHATMKLEEIVR